MSIFIYVLLVPKGIYPQTGQMLVFFGAVSHFKGIKYMIRYVVDSKHINVTVKDNGIIYGPTYSHKEFQAERYN